MTKKFLIGALGVAAFLWSQQAGAFECPRPEMASAGVLDETKQDDAALAHMFAANDIENQIGIAVADLQKKYPDASDTELANYLIGGYCPVVAKMDGLTDAQKTAKVEHFAATLYELLAEQKL